jgi:hypothetical protein
LFCVYFLTCAKKNLGLIRIMPTNKILIKNWNKNQELDKFKQIKKRKNKTSNKFWLKQFFWNFY